MPGVSARSSEDPIPALEDTVCKLCADADGDRELLSRPQLGITKDFRRQANAVAIFLDL